MSNVKRIYLTDYILVLLLSRSFSSWFNLCVLSPLLCFQFCLICRCLKRWTLHQTELNRIFRLVAPATIAGTLPNEIEQNKVLDSFYVSVSVVKESAYLRKGGCNVAVMRMIFFFKKALHENRGTTWFIRWGKRGRQPKYFQNYLLLNARRY